MSWQWIVDETIQPKWAAAMETRLNNKLGALMALVELEQADLDNLASAVETEVAALNSSATAINDAAARIQAALANLPQPLAAADEAAINQALADLASAADGITSSAGNVSGLVPAPPA